MMAEPSLAVATTQLAGGRVSQRRALQNKKVRVLLDSTGGELIVVMDDDRENPIKVAIGEEAGGEDLHLAIMGYSATKIKFLEEF